MFRLALVLCSLPLLAPPVRAQSLPPVADVDWSDFRGRCQTLLDALQKIEAGKKDRDRWLELAIVAEKPFVRGLSGARLEYRIMTLTARQSGKREATLAFDVGQGTQDLGYRAEVPILFTVRPR